MHQVRSRLHSMWMPGHHFMYCGIEEEKGVAWTRGSHLYVACWSVCDRDQDYWSAKSVIDCVILLKLQPHVLDPLIFTAQILPWSLDRLSKRALIGWFNFDPSHKHFNTGTTPWWRNVNFVSCFHSSQKIRSVADETLGNINKFKCQCKWGASDCELINFLTCYISNCSIVHEQLCNPFLLKLHLINICLLCESTSLKKPCCLCVMGVGSGMGNILIVSSRCLLALTWS